MLKCKLFVFFLLGYFCCKSLYAVTNTLTDDNTWYNNPNSPFYNIFYNSAGYYYFQNNGILNLAPTISFNGLPNKEIKFAINGVDANFLNLPFNSATFINPFFLKEVELTPANKALNTGFIGDYINAKTVNANSFINQTQASESQAGVVINSTISNPNLIANNNLVGYFKTDNTNLLLGINYFYLKNSFNSYKGDSKNLNPFDSYSNIVSFEYAPLGKDASLKITNLNFLANARRDISDNQAAQQYFGNNFLKQKTLGNILSFSYEANPKDNPLWHYTSSLAISNQYFIFNQKSSLLTTPQINYEGINYKVQNISNISLFYNQLALTYGFNLAREKTNNNSYNNKTLWTKGVERDTQIYLVNDLDVLSFNKVHLISGVIFNIPDYKASGFNTYGSNSFTPSLELQIMPIAGIKFYGSYLYKERSPHIYEKYINGSYFYNNYFMNFVPNDDLKEEKSNQFKGGVAFNLDFADEQIKLAADVSAFYYKTGNYIDYNFLPNNTMQFSNIRRAILKGYNASLRANIYNLQNQITYTFVKGVDENGNNLNNLFPSNVVLDSALVIPSLGIKPGVRARFFNSFNNFNNNYPFAKNKLPGYSLFDVYLEYIAFNNNLNLSVGVENIFNKKYELPYVSNLYQDRTYFFNITLKL